MSTSPRSRATACSATRARASSRDVTKAVGIRQRQFRHQRRLPRLRQGRPARPLRGQLRAVDREGPTCGARSTLLKSVLHARVVQGHASKLYRNLGGRFEDASQKAGVADPNSKSLGGQRGRLQLDGWPDIFVANDTQPNKLVPQQQERHLCRVGHVGRCRLQRRWRGPRRDGVRYSADYDRSAAPTCSWATSRTRCSALLQRRQGPVRGRGARSSVAARACSRSRSACSSSTTTSMATPTSSRPTATSRKRSARVQPKVQYKEPPLLFRNLASASSRTPAARWGDVPAADRGARRRLCRLRQGRRPRRAVHHQPRTGLSCSATTAATPNNFLCVRTVA